MSTPPRRYQWVMPAYIGPDSPQTPVRIPSREEVNQMTDEIHETPAETEAEEATETEAAEEATEAEGDSPE